MTDKFPTEEVPIATQVVLVMQLRGQSMQLLAPSEYINPIAPLKMTREVLRIRFAAVTALSAVNVVLAGQQSAEKPPPSLA
jgi:hypothetical protein